MFLFAEILIFTKGLLRCYDQTFFNTLQKRYGIDLENLVYYRGETHYFVFTPRRGWYVVVLLLPFCLLLLLLSLSLSLSLSLCVWVGVLCVVVVLFSFSCLRLCCCSLSLSLCSLSVCLCCCSLSVSVFVFVLSLCYCSLCLSLCCFLFTLTILVFSLSLCCCVLLFSLLFLLCCCSLSFCLSLSLVVLFLSFLLFSLTHTPLPPLSSPSSLFHSLLDRGVCKEKKKTCSLLVGSDNTDSEVFSRFLLYFSHFFVIFFLVKKWNLLYFGIYIFSGKRL